MPVPEEAELLRVFVSESDKHQGRPLYEAIVEAALREGLAGATVLRGCLGFGAHHQIHTAKILQISEKLPMVIEIIDAPERIAAFLPHLRGLLDRGIATLEKVRVVFQGSSGSQRT